MVPKNDPVIVALDSLAASLDRVSHATFRALVLMRKMSTPTARRQSARIRAASAKYLRAPSRGRQDIHRHPHGKHRTRGQIRTLRAELRRARRSGISGPKLAKKHGISTAYVYLLTNRKGGRG